MRFIIQNIIVLKQYINIFEREFLKILLNYPVLLQPVEAQRESRQLRLATHAYQYSGKG